MAKIQKGTTEAHEKLTAQAFFKISPLTGYVDCGNLADYKEAHERSTVTRKVSADGFRRVDDEQVADEHMKWEATLDERTPGNEKLIALGSMGADVTQAAQTAPDGTAQFTSVVQGDTYFIGKTDVSTLVVKVGASTKTLGTDYTANLKAGYITIIVGGGIADAATVDLTFGNSAQVTNVITCHDTPLFRGAIRILEFNQHSKIPLRQIDFTGTIIVTAFPEQSGEFMKYTVRFSASSIPVITKRHAV
jgi:hypothetical protein